MPVVDFSGWVVPDLVIPLGGVPYTVHPPSVEGLKLIIALAVVAEVRLRIVDGPVPPETQSIVDGMGTTPIGDVSLGPETHAKMLADGVHPETIRRTAVFAVHYWARGMERAEIIARALWALDHAEADDDPEDADPKSLIPVTEADWDFYGRGVKDPDTRMWSKGFQIPKHIQEAMAPGGPGVAEATPDRVIWWFDIVQHWDLVIADMGALYGVDLFDPSVLARPCQGVRTMILTLPGHPRSLLHHALGGES